MGSTGLSHSLWLPLGYMHVQERRQKQMKQMQKSYLYFIGKDKCIQEFVYLEYQIPTCTCETPQRPKHSRTKFAQHRAPSSPHLFMCLFFRQLFIECQLVPGTRITAMNKTEPLPSMSLHFRVCVAFQQGTCTAARQQGISSHFCHQLAIEFGQVAWLQFLTLLNGGTIRPLLRVLL